MNWPSILAIVRRDLTVVARSRFVLLPILILPAIFFVFLPTMFILLVGIGGSELEELRSLIETLPPAIRDQLGGGALDEQLVRYLLDIQFVTLFLIVPLLVASTIAADSLAGEKERKTLEALTYTPTTDFELYLAKLLGPWIAAILIALLGHLLLVLTVNIVSPPAFARPLAVTPLWLVTVLWVNPAVAALAMGSLVIISAHVRTFMEAYQVGGFIVLPVVLLLLAQFAGVIFIGAGLAILIGAIVWLVAAFILWIGYRGFRRERLLLTT